ncbi:MAG: Hsp33 family molecular chaperone HslO [Bacilli bacterium]|nr:Hsp33 family molecular chaperone HslO [Bacilli bacterium]
MNDYKDYMIRGQDKDGQVRFFAVTTKKLVDEKVSSQHYSPIAGAGVGRLMSAALMMGWMLKNKDERISIQIKGEGPMGGLVASSNCEGLVKGYAENPDVMLPPNEFGHLAVGDSLTPGRMSVIRYSSLGEPHVTTIDLVSGEIGDDLSYYFGQSEQTPSLVGVGVSFNKEDVRVKAAGGFIVQLLPGAKDETITKLETNVLKMRSVSNVLHENNDDPEALIKLLLEGFDYEVTETKDVFFHCDCSMEKSVKILLSLSLGELEDIEREGKGTSICCGFCGEEYKFSPADISAIIEKKKKAKK